VIPQLLDLYCGAGGASMGYARAGFRVTGVDLKPQPRYPFRFIQADAMRVLAGHVLDLAPFTAIHASPPCQLFSRATVAPGVRDAHVDLLTPTRVALDAIGKPYVIENVEGAPLRNPVTLCGTEFGLRAWDETSGLTLWLKRHRLFESWPVFLMGAGGCHCSAGRAKGVIGGVYGGGSNDRNRARTVRHGGYTPPTDVRGPLLGVDWPMTQYELSQAIPPAYTHFLGLQLMDALVPEEAW